MFRIRLSPVRIRMENRTHDKGFFANRFFAKKFIGTLQTAENAITAFPRNPRQDASTTQVQKNPTNAQSVFQHSGECVKGGACTNGGESFRALLERGYYGICHRMSVKHLQKCINKFADRTNVRPVDTMDQINLALNGLAGKRLAYCSDESKQGLRP